jgi:hypothetical protein
MNNIIPIPKRVFIGIPIYGSAPALFISSLTAFAAAMPIHARISFKVGDSLVSRARNSLTADFLASDCTHLLFIDSDLGFTPQDIVRITSHNEHVVGGIYPLKTEGALQWCGNGSVEDAPTVVREDGLQEVRFIGTGFLCISRDAFVKIIAHDHDGLCVYESDSPGHRSEFDFWRVGVRPTADKRRRYLSEDWYFCQRWLELGGKVFADTRVILRHEGRAVWPLQSQQTEIHN